MRSPLDSIDYRARVPRALRLPFQYGFESEFANPSRCLEFFAPTAEVPRAPNQAEALKAFCLSLSHGDKRTVLEKIPGSGPEFLPSGLHRDDTGNVELVMGPFDHAKDFHQQVNWVNENLGVGSLQAMVSLPPADFFGSTGDGKKVLGWLNFFNELDVLERIESGRLRLANNPNAAPLKSFLHPYLGPMIALRHRLLKKFLRENAIGQMLGEEDLIRPARRDQSFKFVGSTAYRPDIAGPARFCLEVRDAHQDPDLLMNRVARIEFYWEKGLGDFTQFSELPPFDSAEVFSSLDDSLQTWLRAAAPGRAPAVVLDFEKARFTYEVYRNFTYPLRDWSPWAEVLGADLQLVKEAQANYLARLEAAKGGSGVELQRALVPFAQESGLHVAFRKKENLLAEGNL